MLPLYDKNGCAPLQTLFQALLALRFENRPIFFWQLKSNTNPEGWASDIIIKDNYNTLSDTPMNSYRFSTSGGFNMVLTENKSAMQTPY